MSTKKPRKEPASPSHVRDKSKATPEQDAGRNAHGQTSENHDAARAPNPIVAVGSSAGGLEALQEFFSTIPPDTGIAFVVITHVRAGRDTMLPELLSTVTRMEVVHAGESTPVLPNRVVIARDSLLDVSKGVMRTAKADGQETAYHPIDHFFRSLAADHAEHAIGIVLSGSGNDGAVGLKAIKAAGGMVMVQSPESAKYTGMPDSAIATRLVDHVLPPREMAKALVAYVQGPYMQLLTRPGTESLPDHDVQAILVRLRAHTGQDFTGYKRTTISRRIRRRMDVHHLEDARAYLSFLRDNHYEMDALMNELLISVTSFFRDQESWDTLAKEALPRLLREHADGRQVRVWVPGCATGEEAYSVAIVLLEEMQRSDRANPLQVFATDLDERAIDVARAGRYPEGIAVDVTPERLKAFFSREDGFYRINKSVRDCIVFAQQNLISDPPFTRLDLIVCRNVLIYLDSPAQKQVLPNFHYALRPGGILFLGSAESVSDAGQLFEPVNARHKILRRKDVATPVQPIVPSSVTRHLDGDSRRDPRLPREEQVLSRRVAQLLLEKYVPCSILVDDRGMIVHLQGRSGMFLEPEQGRPRNNVLEMAREGLGPALGSAMRQAVQEQKETLRTGIRVRNNGGHTLVDLTVLPLSQPEIFRGMLLLTMRPTPAPPADTAPAENLLANVDFELESELQRTREILQSTIEELETSNEELKSSNEELQSTNEELQSSNEELETSKEEMQSLNEELNTVNAELQGKVDALARANDDMNNLLNSMHVATIFLDSQLRVKRYTEQARDVVRLISSDIGRPLSDLTSTLRYPDLIEDCERVIARLMPIEKEVQDQNGHWYLVRLLPYRTGENRIEGIVMTVLDVHRSREAEESLRVSLAQTKEQTGIFEAMMDQIPLGITIAEGDMLRISAVSRHGLQMMGLRAEDVVGKTVDRHNELFGFYHPDGKTPARPEELPLARAARLGEVIRNETWLITRGDGSRLTVLCNAAPIRDQNGQIRAAVVGWQDIGEQRRATEDRIRDEAVRRAATERGKRP